MKPLRLQISWTSLGIKIIDAYVSTDGENFYHSSYLGLQIYSVLNESLDNKIGTNLIDQLKIDIV